MLGGMADILVSPYITTKHAMNGFFMSLNMENYFLETNVSITVASPGFVGKFYT